MTRQEKKKQGKRKQRERRLKQEKHQRRQLRAQRAKKDPQPAPTARSYFIQQIWDKLGLDAALEKAGIVKDGLPLSTIFIIVLLMGVMGATSLHNLIEVVPQDAALWLMLALETLEEKQIYRGLAQVKVSQYQVWMSELLKSLQADVRTASQQAGVVMADTTQIVKRYSHKIPGVHILFVHSEKIFVKGVEIINTHYADDDKDYPLFMEFYQPDEAVLAERAAQKARRQAGVDARKPASMLAYLAGQVSQGNIPKVVTIAGPQLTEKFTRGLDELGLPWLGVSSNRRVYTLNGSQKKQKSKTLLTNANPHRWLQDPDLGYRFAPLGPATGSVGQVLLLVAEHMADRTRTLYLVPAATREAEAIARISLVLSREQSKQEKGILGLTLKLLELSRKANIQAENAAFDRWFFIPWFIQAVLALGFKRVVIKAKAGFTYTYQGQAYDLPDLWTLISDQDFKPHQRNAQTYWLASLIVDLKDVGPVKLVFVKQPMRRRQGMLKSVLMCTDVDYPDQHVLRVYLLRWRIEVCYREVKQNHCFGQFHAQNMETNYGQSLLSLVAYLFEVLLKLIVPALAQQTLGWIKNDYLNAIVSLMLTDGRQDPDYVIEFPGWLIDDYGLPDWNSFSLPDPNPTTLC
jgi:hypothetical protein